MKFIKTLRENLKNEPLLRAAISAFSGVAITLPIIATTLVGCSEPTEPTRAEYRDNSPVVCVKGLDHVILEDLDGDGVVDAITQPQGPGRKLTLYLDKKYENKTQGKVLYLDNLPYFTRTMSDSIRESASNLLKASQDLAFEIAHDRYQTYTNRLQKP